MSLKPNHPDYYLYQRMKSKIESKDIKEAYKLIYQWVKTDLISLSVFRQLIDDIEQIFK